MKNTVKTFQEAKNNGEKLTMLTAYDYSTAKLIDESGVNSILVGDSLGNAILGYDNTVSVTMEDMIHHGAAVARGAKNALVVVDMPFMSYQISVESAMENAGRIMKEAHADAVKLEGGTQICPQIRSLVDAGIPVCAHIGMTPQSIHAFGGFKVQGKDVGAALKIVKDAKAVEAAGAFAVVVECVPAIIGKKITEMLKVPVIGIGAGPDTDGQVLVYQDMLGIFSDFVPKFVKQFAQVGELMRAGFADYDKEVKAGTFPGEKQSYAMAPEEEEEFEKLLGQMEFE